MRKHHHEPYSEQKRLIPKDRRVPLGSIHPVEYYDVSNQDIAMAESATGGSGADVSNPDNPPSGTGGGTGGIEDLIQAEVIAGRTNILVSFPFHTFHCIF